MLSPLHFVMIPDRLKNMLPELMLLTFVWSLLMVSPSWIKVVYASGKRFTTLFTFFDGKLDFTLNFVVGYITELHNISLH